MNTATRLLLMGAGKMGGAMLEGWLKAGLPPANVSVIEPHPSEHILALQNRGVTLLNADAPITAAPAFDVVLLAVKPQSLDQVAGALAKAVQPETLLISVLAGKTIANLMSRAPQARAIVRAMPNTPASVGRGITGCAASAHVSPAQRQLTNDLLSAIGQVIWVENETLIDAVTAVSGSGPAYVFHLVEALAAAGVSAGLPPETAMQLARATVEGAGELLYREPAIPAATLRQNVTSPGGTTAAALDVLMAHDGLTALMTSAVLAAKRRGGALSG
jgi:pyrroline-5-carboxylate reductase